jgi:hypothetical protein
MQIPYSMEQGIIFSGTGNLGARTGNFACQIRNHCRMRFSVHTGAIYVKFNNISGYDSLSVSLIGGHEIRLTRGALHVPANQQFGT